MAVPVDEKMHAWSHLFLFLMLFAIAVAVMRLGGPTGLATGNETISADGITDLKPFLTAVGLLMGLFIAIAFVTTAGFGSRKGSQPEPEPKPPEPEPEPKEMSLGEIEHSLASIRRKIRRIR